MLADSDGSQKQIGFIAQNLETLFPSVVMTDSEGNKSVSYSAMTPIITAAVQELHLNLQQIENFAQNTDGTDSVFVTKLREWLASATNGVTDLFTKKVHSEQICLKKADGSEYCVDGDQLQSMMNNQGTVVSGGGASPSTPPTEPTDPTDTPVDGGSTTPIDPNDSGSIGEEAIPPAVDPVPDTGSNSIPTE
jgi:hypothetical protein